MGVKQLAVVFNYVSSIAEVEVNYGIIKKMVEQYL